MSASESPQLPKHTLLRRTAAWTTYGTIGLVTAVLLATWFRREFNHDDFFFAYTAWLRAVDAVPFRDYYLNTFTIQSELAAPLFRWFPESFLPLHIARAVILVVIALLVLTIYRVTRALEIPRNWALLAPLTFLCQPDVIRRMTDIRSDGVAALFLMLAALAILAPRPERRALIAGMTYGCAIAFSSKLGLALPFLLTGLLLRAEGRRSRDFVVFGLAATIAPASYYGWRIASDGFEIFTRVWSNLFGEMQSVPSAVAGTLQRFSMESPITTIAIIAGAIGCGIGARHDRPARRAVIYTALALGFIATTLIINPFLFPYNFLIIVPVLAPLVACIRFLIPVSRVALEHVVILAVAVGALSQAATPLVVTSQRSSENQIALIEWMWRSTTPDERIFDWQGMHIGRRGVYHWWHYTGFQQKYLRGWYSLADELRRAKVTLIIDNFRMQAVKPDDRRFLQNHFVRSAPCVFSPGVVLSSAEIRAGKRFDIFVSGEYRIHSRTPVMIDGVEMVRPVVDLTEGMHDLQVPARVTPSDVALVFMTRQRERVPPPCPPENDPILKAFQ